MKGRDGKTQGVLGTVAGNRTKLTKLRRPIQHLIPVECTQNSNSDAMNPAGCSSPDDRRTVVRCTREGSSESTRSARGRPIRQAAIMSDRGNLTDQQAIDQVYQQIHQACKDIGFFYITGHGVEQSTMDLLFSYAQKFFALPLEKKTAISIDKCPSYNGYVKSGSEKTQNVVDIREGVYLGANVKHSHQEDAMVTCDNFPQENELPGFAETVETYKAQLTKLGFAMMRALAVGLGLPDDYFADKCSPPMIILALWHYPPYPADTDSWGVGPHTDYGMWTFLLQDGIGGLEVEITEGQWVEVKPIPGTLVVNMGDCLQAWTKGLYRATRHRVRRSIKTDRYSMPFFFNPNRGCIIEPVETNITRNLSFTKVVKGQELPFTFGDFSKKLLEKSHDWNKGHNKTD